MSAYLSRILPMSFEQAVSSITEELKRVGFRVIANIEDKATLIAYQSLRSRGGFELMLPCNIVIQEVIRGRTEVAATDPLLSIRDVRINLDGETEQVRARLKTVINNLKN
ncbi:DUF302 domain-containing protein [Candidatus Omnitrophota bacterium]